MASVINNRRANGENVKNDYETKALVRKIM